MSGHELLGHIVNYRYIEIQSCKLSFLHSPVRLYLTIAAQITIAAPPFSLIAAMIHIYISVLCHWLVCASTVSADCHPVSLFILVL